ncbi:MAG: phosphomannomutase [Promethearchaeota archaeon CR_4]|nr:MAG: phosphomannomutase [Candidatus Lokiarchaeota archaeon CR_4]
MVMLKTILCTCIIMEFECNDAGHLACFGAYDIRGKVPSQLNEELVNRLAKAYATQFKPKSIVIGRDVRLSSQNLAFALFDGFVDMGVDVIDIGLCGTEMLYFAVGSLGASGGIMVTASHNPSDYNGLKLVREHAIPISGDSGLYELERNIIVGDFPPKTTHSGKVKIIEIMPRYIDHLLSFVKGKKLKPFRIVTNAGNGNAGPVLDALESHVPFELIKLNTNPDGTFPNGVPNPLLPENRTATVKSMQSHTCDFGVAWDGDFDRCFFFDEQTNFIEGYYIVGLLARQMLMAHPRSKIILDPRLTWNTIEQVQSLGGTPVISKTGHAFIKERMRKEDAVYGGEMSAHHYFRDFYYCDTGMVPFLLISALLSSENKHLGQLVSGMMDAHPCSGEINFQVTDPPAILKRVEETYKSHAKAVDYIDGLSIEFATWRFNLRMSNTEPLIRLNVETRGDRQLLKQKTRELQGIIK